MYHIYGLLAKEVSDSTLAVCRTTLQKYSEPYMIQDISQKLLLKQTDSLLEIGCGTATLLYPLTLLVNESYGIDHQLTIDRLNNSPVLDNCHLISGNWLEDTFSLPKVDKVLIYSVIHYMNSFDQAIEFIEKSLSVLKDGGRLLVGDIPNSNKKERFSATNFGKEFNEKWRNTREKFTTDEERVRDTLLETLINRDSLTNTSTDNNNEVISFEFSDKMVVQLILHFRKQGHEVYLLPQEKYLPFGYTREDIVIIKSGQVS
ncbi:hypothetical protein SAMN03159341_111124 [Paenibacillus sp. 1_12]|uniref:class I SAM-dependent methyltransferase n=1 Tax=Paenibacillus sp. 1_12 TaxID=1566278 RepID=UPI0008F026C4|nr:methyltransferase domain-containing protein [Paenibacillus sp. 1_12]SFL89283.1 hypothetical protein SAMN03159341_111124 [Paenibacillus sp. 1_12]